MCGFTGFWAPTKNSQHLQWLNNALLTIQHRGPDSSDTWNEQGIFLGHQRLSIHDLSSAGQQPMLSACSRYMIVFNGEIYNFEELRDKLPIQVWKSSSDTEVMLAAFEQWGIAQAVEEFNGMFAFAVWDREQQELTLARDRFGEKPLYYSEQTGFFAFASELSCLETLPELSLTIDRESLSLHANRSYIPAPSTIYNEVKKLMPGTCLTFKPGVGVKTTQFWSLSETVEKGKLTPILDENEAIELLDSELRKSVKMRMASDVPLGAFLSGGIDSSMIVALMQAQSSTPINTFSIGFNVPGYNEAEYALQVANYLGTQHHEQYLEPEQVLDIVPRIGAMFDEPFSDASQLPTYLVSAMAKQKVTVCLSGDGGDELFAGYKRYQAIPEMWKKVSAVPARKTVASVLENMPISLLDKVFFFLQSRAKKYGREGQIGPKVKKLAHWMKAQDLKEFYEKSMMHWPNHNSLVLGVGDCSYSPALSPEVDDFIESLMCEDTLNYLPGDILTKVDRATMQVSLEGRIPFLDHNVAELAWRMPMSMKIKDGDNKWILKQVLYRYLPKNMMDRPKLGFGVPIHLWLREELAEWAQDLLSYERLKAQGIYNPQMVQGALKSHLQGEENNAAALWDVLMVQEWLDADSNRKGRI
ncbi:asparagine synthase (glutamine-hydrolyzing) [Vibrio jasicida]|uniref:asparagine synthase (glutamine-hydrolyzing) n=1 Tax=Vibrio jasicida TaxID=766224 RepID=UPI00148B9B74|nr:asparagine synthase (glutamine-hydrolyzing) [Vibrio jasicida]NOJ20347.1 asparagine synthase (glutamine-hydrolyzing) [Vibrio jasicida]